MRVVHVHRTLRVDAPRERVWNAVSDPERRVRSMPSVKGFRKLGDGEYEWDVEIPLLRRTLSIRTRDVERVEGKRVVFEGGRRFLSVRGEHELTDRDGSVDMHVDFRVDSRIPGVEAAFEHLFDRELEAYRRGLERDLA